MRLIPCAQPAQAPLDAPMEDDDQEQHVQLRVWWLYRLHETTLGTYQIDAKASEAG